MLAKAIRRHVSAFGKKLGRFGLLAAVLFQITPTPEPPAVLGALVTARFQASTLLPLTGQAFTLEMIASFPPGTEMVELPTFPTLWGEFDVQEVGEVTLETLADGTEIYRQQITLKLWRPFDYNTPDTYVSYRLNGMNEALQVPVRGESITVRTVLDFDALTLKPFKPLMYLPYVSPLLVISGVLIGSAIIGLGYYRWSTRPIQPPPSIPELSPRETALQTLERLKSRDDVSPSDRYAGAADALRVYIQQQYGAATAETALREQLGEKALNELNRILADADLVKFAGIQPDDEIARRVVEVTRRWILSSERGDNAET